jgi:hypothetical protein
MKEIILTQGKTTMVDDHDYEWLNSYKWHAVKNKRTYYAKRATNKKGKYVNIFMHNFIMCGFGNDHIDNDGLNNQRSNLRKADKYENARNRRSSVNGTSKYIGVYKSRYFWKWRSEIRCMNKLYSLGCYAIEEDAARAYDKKAKELFGEFANLNFK